MVEKDWIAITDSPLFCGCKKELLPSLLDRAGAYQIDFLSGDAIPFSKDGQGRIGIVLRGRINVFSSEKKEALLNRLTPGSVFGVSSLYTAKSADTFMSADLASRILFLDEEMLDPIWENPITRKNLISFLAGRIRFLTEKIASFTSPDAKTKLSRYLSQNADENGVVSTFRSYCELAKTLNLGRASLYRTLEKMEEKSIIKRQGKTVKILKPNQIN